MRECVCIITCIYVHSNANGKPLIQWISAVSNGITKQNIWQLVFVSVCMLCAHFSLVSLSPFVQRRSQAETQWWGGWLRQTHWIWERERQGAVAMGMTYSQLPHPIVVACGVIGFEMREGGREGGRGGSAGEKEGKWAKPIIRIWSLNKSAMFALTHVCLLATWAFDFLLWAAGSSLQAHSNPPELTNLWAVRSQPVFSSSHVTGAALCLWNWSGTRSKIVLLLLLQYQIFIIQCFTIYCKQHVT